MFAVEFSHHAGNCTFETLTSLFGIADTAVNRIAGIVHDLDMKDRRFNEPEAAGIGILVEGLRQRYANDQKLLEQGIAAIDSVVRGRRMLPARVPGSPVAASKVRGASAPGKQSKTRV